MYAAPPNPQWHPKTIVGPSHPPHITSQATDQIIGSIVKRDATTKHATK